MQEEEFKRLSLPKLEEEEEEGGGAGGGRGRRGKRKLDTEEGGGGEGSKKLCVVVGEGDKAALEEKELLLQYQNGEFSLRREFKENITCLSVYQVRLYWLPLPCIALIRPSQLSCLGSSVGRASAS